MKAYPVNPFSFLLVMVVVVSSQTVPYVDSSRLVDWSNAGLLPETPVRADNVLNINDYTGSDYDKIVNAITEANSLPGTTIIYFPTGTYTVDNTVSITNVKDDGIIFQGDGSESSLLVFDGLDADNHCINTYGSYDGSAMFVTQDIDK